jgi:hypothetical protein
MRRCKTLSGFRGRGINVKKKGMEKKQRKTKQM